MLAVLKDWMQLLRISGIVTVIANCLASCIIVVYAASMEPLLLARQVYDNIHVAAWIIVSSLFLYLAGMLWNDICDVERDRELHPYRPIASGRVSLMPAISVGVLLFLAALIAAAQCGYRGFLSAALIATLIMFYNTGAKHVPIFGSLIMASIRFSLAIYATLMLGNDFFDRMLLTSLSIIYPEAGRIVGSGQLTPVYPLLLGCYIFGVTFLSELESRRSVRLEILLGGLLLSIPLISCLLLLPFSYWIEELLSASAVLLAFAGVIVVLVLFALMAWRVLLPWWRSVQSARRDDIFLVVIRALGGIVFFDALAVAVFQPIYGLVILSLFPLLLLMRRVARME